MKNVHILVSADALAKYRAAIEQIAAQAPSPTAVTWVLPSDESALHERIEIAFITREVTGASTKTHILPDLANFYVALRRATGLRWVHNHASGTDRPIFAELRERGVRITTSSGVNADPVAHTAVGALIALARKFPRLWRAQQATQWVPMLNDPELPDLTGQTAMVIGMGPIGRKIGRILHAMDMQVIGVTRQPDSYTHTTGFSQVLGFDDLEPVLAQTRHVLLACPLTAQTQELVNAAFMKRLPQGAVVINVSRGQVIHQDDLIEALQSHLGGAFLDVFAVEPLDVDSPLWRMPHVLISPHTAGHFTGYAEKVAALFMHNLSCYLSDQALTNEWFPS